MATLSVEPNERVTFRVTYEDEHLLVVEKRAGLVTHPGIGHERDTLLNGLFARFGPRLQNLGQRRDFGLVQRLDRETSGLLLVALSHDAHARLDEMIRAREVEKFYWAISARPPREPQGIVRLSLREVVRPINRYKNERIAQIARDGKPALTAYRTLETSPHGVLLEARPITGRLHQIRVHLDAIGCPILGDPQYGSKHARAMAPRLCLHAHRLRLAHPMTGESLDIRSSMPRDLRRVLRDLRLALPAPSAQHREEVAGDGVGEKES